MEAVVVKSIATPLIKEIFSLLKGCLNKEQLPREIEFNVEHHIAEVLSWGNSVQFFEMHSPKSTDESTIELQFGIPRKFRNDTKNLIESETDLLSQQGHILILGAPGAGKTTTLKRLSREIFLNEPKDEGDELQLPLLIKLRNISGSIFTQIAKILGLKIREEKKEVIDDLSDEIVIQIEYFIGDKHIETAIQEILNKTRALLLIDGLDELPEERKTKYEEEISFLGSKLLDSKIILTCRSGGYVSNINGFKKLEICPLDSEQTDEIIIKWADEPEIFKSKLAQYPYADTVDRPLFLNQLIMSFNYYGDMPAQPSEVYERIISLMLTQWDLRRKVKRKSTYSDFSAERKIKFLSSLAYELTYKIKSKVFSTKDLIIAYQKICKKFRLPISEAELVVEEVESHTGIVSKTTNNKYEFSHLSLQEFLCALHIVREPIGDLSSVYLKEYAPPVAVAIAISSSPSRFLSTIILRDNSFNSISLESLKILISRLSIENPVFEETAELGLAFIKLLTVYSTDTVILDAIEKYLKLEEVVSSLRSVMQRYYIDISNSDQSSYELKRRCLFGSNLQIQTPEGGKVQKYITDSILEKCQFNLYEVGGCYQFAEI
ncbi:NACHT domain-containing protein [Pseudoalteromonas phenolica]|uniref:NACHT domain-containing protein n=1 Tax=Pseudoalteromonas phenolica TaxID=161398 RepID=UPI00110A480E|nr:NACHT domain-containing protein [Pseudoalteromonas phenolica]TMO57108.1 hypothetical protein CWC21_04275 [Pseudoalteromonas phenolica]